MAYAQAKGCRARFRRRWRMADARRSRVRRPAPSFAWWGPLHRSGETAYARRSAALRPPSALLRTALPVSRAMPAWFCTRGRAIAGCLRDLPFARTRRARAFDRRCVRFLILGSAEHDRDAFGRLVAAERASSLKTIY